MTIWPNVQCAYQFISWSNKYKIHNKTKYKIWKKYLNAKLRLWLIVIDNPRFLAHNDQTFCAKAYLSYLQGCTNCCSLAARKWRENKKMKRKWREKEEMEREWGNGKRMRKWRVIHSLHFLIFSFSPSSLYITFIKNCFILSLNVKYGT